MDGGSISEVKFGLRALVSKIKLHVHVLYM